MMFWRGGEEGTLFGGDIGGGGMGEAEEQAVFLRRRRRRKMMRDGCVEMESTMIVNSL